jgi:hypothetical protein
MIPAPEASGADWESLWATLTFEAADSGAAPVPVSPPPVPVPLPAPVPAPVPPPN